MDSVRINPTALQSEVWPISYFISDATKSKLLDTAVQTYIQNSAKCKEDLLISLQRDTKLNSHWHTANPYPSGVAPPSPLPLTTTKVSNANGNNCPSNTVLLGTGVNYDDNQSWSYYPLKCGALSYAVNNAYQQVNPDTIIKQAKRSSRSLVSISLIMVRSISF